MDVIIKSLDLHKDPSSENWAVSFIYDDKGSDSSDGDIIYIGSHKDMKKIYDDNKTRLVDVEYFAALTLLNRLD